MYATLLALFLLFQPAPPDDDPPVDFAPQIKPLMTVPRIDAAVKIDGDLSDRVWTQAVRTSSFTEIQPGDQVAPLVETEVLVAYDEAYLYLGFYCYDDPDAVRASLRNRDEMFQDDWVGIMLDTFGDATQAYEIFVNPLGVQGDLLMSPGGEDPGFDIIFTSAGRLMDDGYVVEMAIPFASLRFPEAEVQQWRATFLRNHPRGSRHLYSWAATSQNDSCFLCQFGTLGGMQDMKAGARLDILPAIVGSQAGRLDDPGDPDARFTNGRARAELSMNLRYNVSSSLAAEATINPDFSQVESDAAQIDVNSTFALSFPERRPFFQEGADLFNTWIDVVYTRSINDPIGAAKVTGRAGQTRLVFLSALDDHTPVLLPFEERSAVVQGGRSVSNILRARHSFGQNSFVGATLTDRRLLDGGTGTVASTDLKWQVLKQYGIQAQFAVSDTQEPDDPASTAPDDFTFADGRYTAAFDGERFQGYAFYTSFDRSSRHWSFDLGYRAYSPTFRTANGFVRQNDYQTVYMVQNYDFWPENAVLKRITPGLYVEREMNFDGERKTEMVQPQVQGYVSGQTYFYLAYGLKRERFAGVEFDDLSFWNVNIDSRFSGMMQGGFYLGGGRNIARSLETPETGRERSAGLWITLKPTQRLVINPSIDYYALREVATGDAYFSGYVTRTSISYQFSRELSLRLVTQYNDFADRLDVEPLLSYKINPFSIFYVGSTHGYHEYGQPYGLTQADRQFFFKFQYLFRV